MEIIFLPKADADLSYWIRTGNKLILKRIAQLTKSILKTPFQGIGRPEALKHQLSGKWSRRITDEHRYIYAIKEDDLLVFSLKGHY
jgi:toxin YoeB